MHTKTMPLAPRTMVEVERLALTAVTKAANHDLTEEEIATQRKSWVTGRFSDPHDQEEGKEK